MKLVLIASLVLAQLPLASATAATIENHGASQQQVGAFAGARLRIAVGGEKAGKPTIGLGITGLAQSRSSDGAVRTRLSEGVQFGYSADRKLGLTVAGQPLDARRPSLQDKGEDDDDGISTLGWIGIGVGAALVVAGVGLALWADAISDNSE